MTLAVVREASDSDSSPRRSAVRGDASTAEDILDDDPVSSATPSCITSFLGMNPVELGGAPFALATDEAATRSVRATSTSVCGCIDSRAGVRVLPCIAGHVGADCRRRDPLRGDRYLQRRDEPRRGRGHQRRDRAGRPGAACWPARAPTGPAFEGAQISCGQRAAPGSRRARAHRSSRRSSHAFKVIGSRSLVGRAEAFPPSATQGERGSPACVRLGHHRGASAEMYLAGIIRHGRRRSTAALAARSPRIVAGRAEHSATCCTTGRSHA